MASSTNRAAILRATAEETQKLIPGILALRPDGLTKGYQCLQSRYTPLSSRYFPNLRTRVRVVNKDAFDAAVEVSKLPFSTDTKPVCVLNLASERNPGGGWLGGSMAQEEALCYRSTLSTTLHRRFYPIKDKEAIYSPRVIIFRSNYAQGHALMDQRFPLDFPVVSVISAAAIRKPAVNTRVSPPRYVHAEDRALMKEKMRVILRVAAHNQHRRLVLGAFGCGAFDNPNNEVANCWKEVFDEQEFRGWWENITFAVLKDHPTHGVDNFTMFERELQGLTV